MTLMMGYEYHGNYGMRRCTVLPTSVMGAHITTKVHPPLQMSTGHSPLHGKVGCRPDALVRDNILHKRWTTTAIEEGEVARVTPNIEQNYVLLPPDRIVAGIAQIILKLATSMDQKVIVYFATKGQVDYFEDFFNLALGRQVRAIHSRKSLNSRRIASELFRDSKEGILLTTDISTHCVDYVGLSAVVQVGLPSNRTTYLHRLERATRHGNAARGLMIFFMEEELQLVRDSLGDFDMKVDQEMTKLLELPLDRELEFRLTTFRRKIGDSPDGIAKSFFEGFVTHYWARLKAYSKQTDTSLQERIHNTAKAVASQTGLVVVPLLAGSPFISTTVKWKLVKSDWIPGKEFDVGEKNA